MLIIIQIVLILIIAVFSFIAGMSRGYRFGYKDGIDNNIRAVIPQHYH